MPKLNVTILARLYDHRGKLIPKHIPDKPAHSFLAQFIEFLHSHMANVATSITRTDGNEAPVTSSPWNLRMTAGTALTYGMLIGSGTTPPDIDDYVLETPITADLTVSAHTFVLSYPTANTRRMAISRTFTNGTPSPMQIEEVAMYCLDYSQSPVCIDRTLYSIAIPASSSLELTYRIDVSV